MNLKRIYMLASDHRWQWEEWSDGKGVARPRISEAKQLIFEAFLAAREQSADVRSCGALLLDSTYLLKIEGTSSSTGAAIIDAAIRERPGPRQLILGKGAKAALSERWFDAATALPSTAGFAIGRSVFWKPCTAFLEGRVTSGSAIDTMAASYLDLVDQWNRRAVTT
jgi:myo-inositol catabolism protein IolC